MKPYISYSRKDPVAFMEKLLLESFVVFPYLTLKQRMDFFTEELDLLAKATKPGKRLSISRRTITFCDIHGLRHVTKGKCSSCYANDVRSVQRKKSLNSHSSENS